MRSQLVTMKQVQPAAGADFQFIPAGMERVKLLSLTAILTTSAVVAARQPSLRFQTRALDTYWAADTVNPQPASTAVRYSWAYGTGLSIPTTVVTSGKIGAPLPHLWLDADDLVASTTVAIDVGDQWTQIVYRCLIGDHYMALEEFSELGAIVSAVGG